MDDQSIDAVIIATPQHLHCEHFVHSLEAGKHVYQEKTLAFTLEHAKRMRAAHRQAPKAIVQIGHQACSSGQIRDAVNFLATGHVGKITAIRMHWYRNTPHGKAQWARPVYPDMTPENIAWNSFLGDAPRRDFDPHRFINWRFFEDYSGGNVYENLSQQLAFWYKALNLQIPQAATMTGGLYLWKDGRDVPDTMNVTFQQAEQMLVSWDSGLGKQPARDHRRRARFRRHHLAQPVRHSLPAAKSESSRRRRDGRQSSQLSHRAHAEFRGLHPIRQRTPLPVRAWLPRLYRLPDGARKFPSRPNGALGSTDGNDRLSCGFIAGLSQD